MLESKSTTVCDPSSPQPTAATPSASNIPVRIPARYAEMGSDITCMSCAGHAEPSGGKSCNSCLTPDPDIGGELRHHLREPAVRLGVQHVARAGDDLEPRVGQRREQCVERGPEVDR